MVKEVIMPKLGQTMEEGVILEWLKQEGDRVDRGDVLFTMESDKATLEVEASTKGVLRKILFPEGETVPVLSPVALITKTADEDISGYTPSTAAQGEKKVEAASEAAKKPEPGVERPAEQEQPEKRKRLFASPRARRRAREEGVELEQVTGSGPNGRIVEQDVLDHLASRPKATPVARRLAEHKGVDLSTVTPTGPQGRITKADVERALSAAEPVPSTEEAKVLSEVPMTGVRARIARHMSESDRTTAPVTLTTEADATAFVEVRERMKTSLADELGFNIGYNDLLIKLVARALGQFPYMNARLVDGQGGTIQHLSDVHVALAVDAEQGLLAPVVRDADEKTVVEIACELRSLVDRVRSGTASPDDLSGSTFTITNLGMYEVDAFTPIINLPETAILGVGRIKARPVVLEGEIVARQTVWLSLTFDHRLVDGAPAARFMQRIKQLIEEPYLLLA